MSGAVWPRDVLWKSCSGKFLKINRETPAPEVLSKRSERGERPRILMTSEILEFFIQKCNLFTTELWNRYKKICVDVNCGVAQFVTFYL